MSLASKARIWGFAAVFCRNERTDMQGTITLADTTVSFFIDHACEDSCSLFVQDGLSGKQYRRDDLNREAVFAALIVMIDGDQHEFDQDIHELAESVQSADPELRFIP